MTNAELTDLFEKETLVAIQDCMQISSALTEILSISNYLICDSVARQLFLLANYYARGLYEDLSNSGYFDQKNSRDFEKLQTLKTALNNFISAADQLL